MELHGSYVISPSPTLEPAILVNQASASAACSHCHCYVTLNNIMQLYTIVRSSLKLAGTAVVLVNKIITLLHTEWKQFNMKRLTGNHVQFCQRVSSLLSTDHISFHFLATIGCVAFNFYLLLFHMGSIQWDTNSCSQDIRRAEKKTKQLSNSNNVIKL